MITTVVCRAGAWAVTRPVRLSTLAASGSLLLHRTDWPWGTVAAERVMDWPGARVCRLGVTVTPSWAASSTVTRHRSVWFPSRVAAVITAMPGRRAVTRPSRTQATCSSSLLQRTVWSAASPGSTEALRVADSPGRRVSSFRSRRTPVTGTGSGPVTVRVRGLDRTSPHRAVISAWPGLRPVTTPSRTVATASLLEVHSSSPSAPSGSSRTVRAAVWSTSTVRGPERVMPVRAGGSSGSRARAAGVSPASRDRARQADSSLTVHAFMIVISFSGLGCVWGTPS